MTETSDRPADGGDAADISEATQSEVDAAIEAAENDETILIGS